MKVARHPTALGERRCRCYLPVLAEFTRLPMHGTWPGRTVGGTPGCGNQILAEKTPRLARRLAGLNSAVQLAVQARCRPAACPAAAPGRAVTLELVGQDRPGIVHQITRVLAAHGVNVEELTTECVEAPMAGGMLFQAQAELFIPAVADMAAIRGDLEKIAADLMVDLHFADAQ